jgi:hypothetical protein
MNMLLEFFPIHEIQLPQFSQTGSGTTIRSLKLIQLRIVRGANKIPPTDSGARVLKPAQHMVL